MKYKPSDFSLKLGVANPCEGAFCAAYPDYETFPNVPSWEKLAGYLIRDHQIKKKSAFTAMASLDARLDPQGMVKEGLLKQMGGGSFLLTDKAFELINAKYPANK